MSKITGIKIKNSDNTYSNEIPFGVSASNVEWDSSNTLVDIIEDLQEQSGGQQTITGAASTIVSDNLTVSRAVVSNASGKVAVSDVTSTELGYLDGVTSNIQTQLNGKQTTVTGAASTVVSNNLTGNKVLVSDSTGKITASNLSASSAQYYLSGAMGSPFQDQLNSIANYLNYQVHYNHGCLDPQNYPKPSNVLEWEPYGYSFDLESGTWTTVNYCPLDGWGAGTYLFFIDVKFPANGTGIRSIKVTLGDTSTQLNPWAIASESGSANADTIIKMIVPVYMTWQQTQEAWENQIYNFYVKAYQNSGQTMYNWSDINVYSVFFRGFVPEMG